MMSPVLFSLLSVALAAPQLPAGLTAASCPNYPYCDAITGFLEVPDVPGAEEVIKAQELLLRSNLGLGLGVPAVPGAEAHRAAELAVEQLARPGFNSHAAAEAAVLAAQGRAPANLNAADLAHYQAEQAVLAAQQNLIVQG